MSIARAFSTCALFLGIVSLTVAAVLFGRAGASWARQDASVERLQAYVAKETEHEPPQVDWEGLRSVNADVIGWIDIPGTVVSYPVYQGDTNTDYLRTAADGSYAVGGQVFLDAMNTAPGMVDHQSILYGHHLYNGTMFKTVADMENQRMFDSIDTVFYLTPERTYELEPLMLYRTTPATEDLRCFEFPTNGAFQDYLAERLGEAVAMSADAEEKIQTTYHALTLVTCNYREDSGRTALVCVPKADELKVL